ncbi:MAG TPA: hypothetical protein VN698_09805 [Bacteroidia bacterium]|nr:hypothetical protein [Bacteroidia bacterium]
MAPTKPTVAEFTQDKIEEAKQKYGALKQIDVTLKDGSKESYIIAQPTRTTLDVLSKYYNDGKDHKAREVLNANCILAGNMDAINNQKDITVAETVYGKITDWFDKLQVEEKEL